MHPATRPSPPLAALYGRAARRWQGGIDKLGYPAAYDDLICAAPPGPAARVIDIGTGSGALAAAYLKAAPAPPDQLDLLDPVPAMLREADRRLSGSCGRRRLIEAGIGTALARADSYDAVLAAHVVEHVEDAGAALAWMAGLLRPGGWLYLSASRPHWCTAILRWKWGHQAWPPHQMAGMLAAAGLTRIRVIRYRAGPPSRTSAGYAAQRPPG